MKKGKWQTKLRLERIPCAAAAAMLASSLCAFIFTGIPGADMESTPMLFAMLLCAVFTAIMELAALPNAVLLAGCAAFACAGGALFFVPFGGESLYMATTAKADMPAARVLTMVLLLCGALCLAVCVLNRSFALRCVAAAGLLTMLILFVWLRFRLLTVPAVLITAYILIALCQVCTRRMSPLSDEPREMWFVLFSLITAVIVFSLPYPGTRIRWDKLFEVKPTGQLEQLGETLGVEPIEPEAEETEMAESGFSEDQSSLGGWLELVSDARLRAEFSDNSHSDRLTGGIYDRYTGTGWECVTEPEGTGYASHCDALSVSGSDLHGSVVISEVEKSSSGDGKASLFYPPYSYAVVSAETGDTADREGMRLTFEQPDSLSYKAYYYKQSCGYELTDAEKESLLALPKTLPERVRKLVRKTTEGCENDVSAARALMGVLAGCRYATRVDDLPKGRDFVDYFLFDTKEGYCAYFASAMAVMARCAGIPARYVQGYYLGDSDELAFTVSSGNAHAWAELYIDGQWIVYDPAALPMEEIMSDPTEAPEEIEPERDNSALNRILVCSYTVIAAAAIVFVLFRPLFRRLRWRIKLNRSYGQKPGYPAISRCGALMWTLAACGVKREEAETLAEFCERMRKECGWLDEALRDEISDLFQQAGRALYSSAAAEKRGEDTARKVRKSYVQTFGLAKYLRGYRRASMER